MRKQGFPMEYYKGEVFTEVEVRRRRKNLICYTVMIVSLLASNIRCEIELETNGFQTKTEIQKFGRLNSYPQNVIHELRGGVNLTESVWLLITIWMIKQQSVGFQPVTQAPPPPHRQLFGGTSSLPRNNYFSKSSQPSPSLQMERPSGMPHQEFASLTNEQKRNLPHPKDRFINVKGHQDLVIRRGQGQFKVKDHGEIHDLPYTVKSNGRLSCERSEENIDQFMQSIASMPNRKNIQWFDKGTYQGGTKHGYPAVHIYDKGKQVIAVFKKSTGQFVTTCRLTPAEEQELFKTGNFGGEK